MKMVKKMMNYIIHMTILNKVMYVFQRTRNIQQLANLMKMILFIYIIQLILKNKKKKKNINVDFPDDKEANNLSVCRIKAFQNYFLLYISAFSYWHLFGDFNKLIPFKKIGNQWEYNICEGIVDRGTFNF